MSAPIRVLLLEDDYGLAESLMHWLEMHKIEVDHVVDRKEFEALEEYTYDLAICDYQLIGCTGPELIAILRERSPSTMTLLQSGSFTGGSISEWEEHPDIDVVISKGIGALQAISEALETVRSQA